MALDRDRFTNTPDLDKLMIHGVDVDRCVGRIVCGDCGYRVFFLWLDVGEAIPVEVDIEVMHGS